MAPQVLIQQGAEARVYAHNCFDARLPAITKIRFTKSYRIPDLDAKLSTSRLLQEARSLRRARQVGVPTPRVFFVDKINKALTMEAIDAPTVLHWLGTDCNPSILGPLCKQIGTSIAKLHAANLVHGDLTTSNMLVRHLPPPIKPCSSSTTDPGIPALPPTLLQIVMIDFGLAFSSSNVEDKAVDLYVLERAIRSTHPLIENALIPDILAHYSAYGGKAAASVLRKLDDVRLRGRKRSMIG